MRFPGIIFDFNGVLWWDQHLQEKSWIDFAQAFRGRTFSEQEFAIHVHGRNMVHTLEFLAGHSLNQEQVALLGEQKEAIYRQLCLVEEQDFRLSPGAVELLEFLVQRGIRRTIATASGRRNLDFFIEHLELEHWFSIDSIVYDDGSRSGKPAPDFYLQAAGNLGLPPSRCVVVEDSYSGIQAAVSARIGHIIALGPHTNHEMLAAIDGVDTVIETLADIQRKQLFD